MSRVVVLILHRRPAPDAGPLERLLDQARLILAARHRRGFLAAGAVDVRVVSGPPDDTPFGARLRTLAADVAVGGPAGLVVLGSGAIPLATPADLARFAAVAASGEPHALANSYYSADVVAIGRPDALAALPDLPSDNALPRWLDEAAGIAVADLRSNARLAFDLDSPLDLALLVRSRARPPELRTLAADPILDSARDHLDAVASVMADRRAELLVAGRTSAATLRWLERHTACRIRALVEERGLRASSPLALAGDAGGARGRRSGAHPPRAPRSVLGLLLDRDGPESLGPLLAGLADAAVVDSRVLLAHRHGPDETTWPGPEDRFASDLLRPQEIVDPWLRSLTESAVDAPIPILLGGHTLAGPGLRLVAAGGRGWS